LAQSWRRAIRAQFLPYRAIASGVDQQHAWVPLEQQAHWRAERCQPAREAADFQRGAAGRLTIEDGVAQTLDRALVVVRGGGAGSLPIEGGCG